MHLMDTHYLFTYKNINRQIRALSWSQVYLIKLQQFFLRWILSLGRSKQI